MAQYQVWENEYQNPKLITNSNEPQIDFKHFVKWLRKDRKVELERLLVLDLGSGTGKNSIFLSERESIVTGIDLSDTAVRLAKDRSQTAGLNIKFIKSSIGEIFPFEDNSFDLILDIVSSNSLSDAERKVYLQECRRVLKPEGYVFIKALCKDGDKHATALIEKFPGKEKDTYVMPGTGLIERVWTKKDITSYYSSFKILNFERKSSYTSFEGKSYKRNFWLMYLQN